MIMTNSDTNTTVEQTPAEKKAEAAQKRLVNAFQTIANHLSIMVNRDGNTEEGNERNAMWREQQSIMGLYGMLGQAHNKMIWIEDYGRPDTKDAIDAMVKLEGSEKYDAYEEDRLIELYETYACKLAELKAFVEAGEEVYNEHQLYNYTHKTKTPRRNFQRKDLSIDANRRQERLDAILGTDRHVSDQANANATIN